ncbi:MAG: hypothetical protein ACI3ZT_07160 [Candidatus Cryptobacteroides sp.]
MKLNVTDNCREYVIEKKEAFDDLRHIADCPLDKLTDKDCNDVWVFPSKESRYDDKIEDETILSLNGNRMSTGNIMGFIGYGDTELTIRSRFSSGDNGHDWFMQYMLQKVFAINIFKLQSSLTTEGILDVAAMLFPYFLQKALCQGIYREYIRCHYNDSRARGAIDFSAHIKNNYPFKNGKISYTTREYKYDNSVTQLIRHTIEYLRSKEFAKQILFSSQEMQGFIKQIVEATPTYCKADRNKILLANMKPKIHPYYSEYRPLQKLCIQILRREKMGYGQSSKRVYGVLFDGAWLWEEYLNLTMTKAGFSHPKNKTGEGAIHPFRGRSNKYKRYPDYMKADIIADAKYKRLLTLSENSSKVTDNIQRDDLNQMISYLHITSSRVGIFIGPTEIVLMDPKTGQFYSDDTIAFSTRELQVLKVGDLMGDGGQIVIIGVNIPKNPQSYEQFSEAMKSTETVLLNQLADMNTGNA